MASDLLTAFWIIPPNPDGPLGFGVTAHDIDDALRILRASGYADDFHASLSALRITHDVRYADLEKHVRTNMGPIVVRGLWYPFVRVGL